MGERLIKTEVNIRCKGRITCGRKKPRPRQARSQRPVSRGEIKGYRWGQKRGSPSPVAGGHAGDRNCRRTRGGIGTNTRGGCQLAKRLLAGQT